MEHRALFMCHTPIMLNYEAYSTYRCRRRMCLGGSLYHYQLWCKFHGETKIKMHKCRLPPRDGHVSVLIIMYPLCATWKATGNSSLLLNIFMSISYLHSQCSFQRFWMREDVRLLALVVYIGKPTTCWQSGAFCTVTYLVCLNCFIIEMDLMIP